MPVDSTHADYREHAPDWRVMRDVVAGERAVKARGNAYLPDIHSFKRKTGQEYRMRAPWYGGTARTVTGLVGCLMRVPPAIEAPPVVAEHLHDATLTGCGLTTVIRGLLREVLTVGRAAVQIDATTEGRPYWRIIRAEDLINWWTEGIDGRRRVTRIVVQETVEEADPHDAFSRRMVPQVRVLDLTDGRAQETRYRRTRAIPFPREGRAQAYGPWAPTGPPDLLIRRGEPLEELPVVVFNAGMTGVDVERPPLLDLAHMNLSLYRTQADQEWGAHMIALPTPVIIGSDRPDGADPDWGPGGIWYLSEGMDAKILEVSGAGMAVLRDLADQKTAAMAALGARLIEPPRRAAETAETVRLKAGGDLSMLAALAGAVEAGLTDALRIHTWWSGEAETVRDAPASVSLTRDFLDARLSAQELLALVGAWQAGAVTDHTLGYNLQQGEIEPREAAARRTRTMGAVARDGQAGDTEDEGA